MWEILVVKNVFLIFLIILVNICIWTNATKISEQKCKEYAQFVSSIESSPVLRMDEQKNVVSKCEIIETPLIIGGVQAKSKEFPHMVAIGYGKSGDTDVSWECGGSIISENYVLTASHCLESDNRGPAIRVRTGTTKLKQPDSEYQDRVISERIKHPNYTKPARYHDIALLKLEKSFDLNPAVRPACLDVDPQTTGTSAIASGFGKTSFESEKGSDELMKVQLNYISKENCEQAFKIDLGTNQLPSGFIPNMLCAGILEGGKDTCQGDSGGPLQRILSDPYCMYSIVGVTSFGKFCGFENSPAVYSRVSTYIDWIESIVWSEK